MGISAVAAERTRWSYRILTYPKISISTLQTCSSEHATSEAAEYTFAICFDENFTVFSVTRNQWNGRARPRQNTGSQAYQNARSTASYPGRPVQHRALRELNIKVSTNLWRAFLMVEHLWQPRSPELCHALIFQICLPQTSPSFARKKSPKVNNVSGMHCRQELNSSVNGVLTLDERRLHLQRKHCDLLQYLSSCIWRQCRASA